MSPSTAGAIDLSAVDRWDKRRLVGILLVATFVPLVAAYFKFNTFIAVIAVMAVGVTAALVTFSIQNTLILLFAYICLLPNFAWGSRYTFFKGIYFSELVAWGIFLVLIVWWLAELMREKESKSKRFSLLDGAMLLFVVLVLLATLRGGFENGQFRIIKAELFFLTSYSLYFLFKSRLDITQIQRLWKAVLLISVLVGVQFIMLTLSESSGLSSLLVKRISTQQPHIAQLALPLLIGVILFKNRRSHKAVAFAMLMVVFPMVFLCQQRALWVSTVVSIFVIAGFAFFKDEFNASRVIKFLFASMAILVVMVILILVLDRYLTGSVLLTAFSRITSLLSLSVDESTSIRLSEIFRALRRWQSTSVNLFFGTGFGDSYASIDAARINTHSVDNSFVYLLWKTGLLGLGTYLTICLLFLKRGWYVFRHAANEQYKQIAAALIAGMAGLALIGLTNVCLVLYRFIILWTLAIATVEVLYLKVRYEQESPVSA